MRIEALSDQLGLFAVCLNMLEILKASVVRCWNCNTLFLYFCKDFMLFRRLGCHILEDTSVVSSVNILIRQV